MKNLKIALVHDDLVQWGGAERMLVALSELFPEAPIYTSLFDQENRILCNKFKNKKVITTFLQKMPGWRSFYKVFLPLYPIAFEQFDFTSYNLVISQTTRFAKSILTKPETKHICYCHTPPRFLWNLSGVSNNPLLKPYFTFLKKYDVISSSRVDTWIAGSENARGRILETYHCPSEVVYPFVDLERFSSMEPFDGGYLLVVSRLNSYKKVDLVIQAANKLKYPLKIVGKGPELLNLQKIAGPKVDFLGEVSEDLLGHILSGCNALVVAGEEDFGLTPLEAQALGKPVIAFKKGGALETIIDKETGYFFEHPTIESLIETLQNLDKNGYNKKKCYDQAARFSRKIFTEKFKRIVYSP